MGAVVSRVGAARAARRKAGRLLPQIGWWASVLWVGICMMLIHYAATTPWWLASPWRMTHFVAARPFQHRVLIPLIAVGIEKQFPDIGPDVIFTAFEVVFWMLLIVLARQGLAMFCSGLRQHLQAPLAMTVLVPVAMHLIVPNVTFQSVFHQGYGLVQLGTWQAGALFRYVYDLPAAVFTLMLVLLLAHFARWPGPRRFALYLAVFALAVLNRETAVFMIPAYFGVCRNRLRRGIMVGTLAAQVAVFAVVYALVLWLFPGIPNPHADVPGSQYEAHLADNLSHFANPLYTMVFFARFAAGLYIPVLLLHRHLEPILGRALIWFGLPLLASALVFGRLVEQRVVIEIVPLIWLSAIQAISSWTLVQVARTRRAHSVSTDGGHGAPPASSS